MYEARIGKDKETGSTAGNTMAQRDTTKQIKEYGYKSTDEVPGNHERRKRKDVQCPKHYYVMNHY